MDYLKKMTQLKTVFKYIISLGLIIWLLWSADIYAILKAFLKMNWNSFILILFLYFGSHYINTYKWSKLLKKYSICRLYVITLISLYYTMVISGGQIIGDGVKIYKLSKDNKELGEISASVIIDRITGFIALLVVGIIGVYGGTYLDKENIFIAFIIITILLFISIYWVYIPFIESF
ncbi:MAG: flippase-like domain-containing protein, partial [Desulfobacterales bacterium]|nr:flippase-like domain-containing protein [Desulfobacterales bacterium]